MNINEEFSGVSRPNGQIQCHMGCTHHASFPCEELTKLRELHNATKRWANSMEQDRWDDIGLEKLYDALDALGEWKDKPQEITTNLSLVLDISPLHRG